MSSGPKAPETKEERKPLSFGERVRAGLLIAALPVLAAGGGKGLYEVSQNGQKAEDEDRRETAAKNISCMGVASGQSVIRYEGGQAIVRLAGLSDRQKEDCDLESVESDLESYSGGVNRGVRLPHDAEIVPSSVEVQLPSDEALQSSAQENLSKANNGTTTMDSIERGGMTAAGVLFGAAGWMFGVAGIGMVAGRRQG